MKEFGGYLELEHYHGIEYHNTAIPLNTARNCLRYLIKKYSIKEILLPKYLCSCLLDVCFEEKVKVNFYSIDEKFKPRIDEIEKKLSVDAYVYIINFYGQLDNEDISNFSNVYNNLIIDNVQSFFLKPINKIDTIYTCRKYFGVPDGAYLYTENEHIKDFKIDISYNRMNFLLGRFEKNGKEFFNDFHNNEKILDKEKIKLMSNTTHNILRSIDYENVISIRKRNFKILDENLKMKNSLQIKNEAGLFLYPLLINNGKLIKKKLILNKVYVPTFWPGVENLVDERSFERKLFDDLVLLPLDQRYDEQDMNIILERLFKILKEVNL